MAPEKAAKNFARFSRSCRSRPVIPGQDSCPPASSTFPFASRARCPASEKTRRQPFTSTSAERIRETFRPATRPRRDDNRGSAGGMSQANDAARFESFCATLKTEIADLAQVPAESGRPSALLQSSVDHEPQNTGFNPGAENGNGHANGNARESKPPLAGDKFSPRRSLVSPSPETQSSFRREFARSSGESSKTPTKDGARERT